MLLPHFSFDCVTKRLNFFTFFLSFFFFFKTHLRHLNVMLNLLSLSLSLSFCLSYPKPEKLAWYQHTHKHTSFLWFWFIPSSFATTFTLYTIDIDNGKNPTWYPCWNLGPRTSFFISFASTSAVAADPILRVLQLQLQLLLHSQWSLWLLLYTFFCWLFYYYFTWFLPPLFDSILFTALFFWYLHFISLSLSFLFLVNVYRWGTVYYCYKLKKDNKSAVLPPLCLRFFLKNP